MLLYHPGLLGVEAVNNWNQLCLSFVFNTDERQAAYLMIK